MKPLSTHLFSHWSIPLNARLPQLQYIGSTGSTKCICPQKKEIRKNYTGKMPSCFEMEKPLRESVMSLGKVTKKCTEGGS
jgi:hypothetical protein